MRITEIEVGGFAANCFLAESGNTAILIDPSASPDDVRRQLGSKMPEVSLIVLTHAHFDHMLALGSWRALGVPLAIHEDDAHALGNPDATCFRQFLGRNDTFAAPERPLHDGDRIAVGDESLTVLHTPGHTVGSVCLRAPGAIFTGDTVFTDGGYGRTDLYGGDMNALASSIARLVAMRERGMTMYPGHGPSGDFYTEMLAFTDIP